MNPILRTILKPLASLYGSQVAKRNARFDQGVGVVTFDRPVISVGNLSVGGTGKTPMVKRIISLIRENGIDPCIAMRGYGANRSKEGRSDEADEYAEAFGDLPIVAQPNRTEGLIKLFGTDRGQAVEAVVLDDGFQHRRIARQLDIVLLDATRDPLDDALLPLGRLREPLASLARAHVVVVTHSERVEHGVVDAILEAALRVNPSLTAAVAEHAWAGLLVGDDAHPIEWLADKRALPVCAIGNPQPFIAAVQDSARSIGDPVILGDHDPYRDSTIGRIKREARDADAIVTTAKDWAKLVRIPADVWPCPVVVPKLEMRLVAGDTSFDRLVLAAARRPADTLDA